MMTGLGEEGAASNTIPTRGNKFLAKENVARPRREQGHCISHDRSSHGDRWAAVAVLRSVLTLNITHSSLVTGTTDPHHIEPSCDTFCQTNEKAKRARRTRRRDSGCQLGWSRGQNPNYISPPGRNSLRSTATRR